MLNVTKKKPEAERRWLDLIPDLDPPVRVEVREADRADRIAARWAARGAVRVTMDPASSHVAWVSTLAQRCIVGWEGVGDADGNVVPPTRDEEIRDEETGALIEVIPGTVTGLLDIDAAWDAFEAQFVLPILLADTERADEKKGSSPSLDGSCETAKTSATDAGSSTAKPARPARKKSTSPGRTKDA